MAQSKRAALREEIRVLKKKAETAEAEMRKAQQDAKGVEIVLRDIINEHGMPQWIVDMVKAGPSIVKSMRFGLFYGGLRADVRKLVDDLTLWVGTEDQKNSVPKVTVASSGSNIIRNNEAFIDFVANIVNQGEDDER
jgi:hypothetical protein